MKRWLIVGWIEIALVIVVFIGIVACVLQGIGDGTLLFRGIIATPIGLWWGIKIIKANKKKRKVKIEI